MTSTGSSVNTTIDRAFNGPPESAHGGYACATFARMTRLPPPVAVTLLAPPPLDTPLRAVPGHRRHTIRAGDRLIATVARAAREPRAVDPVTIVMARAASRRFRGFTDHPFPTCFACGHRRPKGSGLGLAPGAVAGRTGTVACPWTPSAEYGDRVPDEVLWSILDCTGGWVDERGPGPMVLSQMSAVIVDRVIPGRIHVAVGTLLRRRGRTMTVATAIHTESGQVASTASAVWTAVSVEPSQGE